MPDHMIAGRALVTRRAVIDIVRAVTLGSYGVAGFAGAHAADSAAQPASASNPLLQESPLPYHLPPFDKIKNEDFAPAYEQGMTVQLKEVDAIATKSRPSPTPSWRSNARDSCSIGSTKSSLVCPPRTRIRRFKTSRRPWRQSWRRTTTRFI